MRETNSQQLQVFKRDVKVTLTHARLFANGLIRVLIGHLGVKKQDDTFLLRPRLPCCGVPLLFCHAFSGKTVSMDSFKDS